ncbi:uncharacterized protein EI90DRAFT_3146725 [Cantharellus anzutake]|uniref:uncharacterized protein n=1 Tax=Cantharellus anzutake TaxID=1750568 RepID=UPI00190755CF|nr:uncharacterized protein EI90DRAFT_3146725 [Cantharellus anzutake]KAF8325222.1 hypothetical protein EI90DRAFT_3146725 [Cantharellus anzutake]
MPVENENDRGSHSHEAEELVTTELNTGGACKIDGGYRDRGTRATMLGFFANLGLTGIKGAAGWYLNSAVLLADAGHSLSDLAGDIITLFFYTFSRRTPSPSYPYGYGKFESVGTAVVSIFLLLAAFAIGGHSYSLLEESIPFLRARIPFPASSDSSFNHPLDSTTDPNAAWIAVFSILIKESVYRIMASIARTENSPVLLANALHHRSDMYSSFVSLIAIIGNWVFPKLPFDPIGGLLVTLLILHQAFELLGGALFELTDRALPAGDLEPVMNIIRSEVKDFKSAPPHGPETLKLLDPVTGLRRGANLFLDVNIAALESGEQSLCLRDVVEFEDKLKRRLRSTKMAVKDIRIRWEIYSS